VFYSANGVSGWSQQSKLVASDGGADDFFGLSVSVWSNVIVVGSYRDDIAAVTDAGMTICLVWYFCIRVLFDAFNACFGLNKLFPLMT
jgi:hypothetical protein